MPSLPAAEGWQGRFTCHAQRPPKKLLTLGTRFYVELDKIGVEILLNLWRDMM